MNINSLFTDELQSYVEETAEELSNLGADVFDVEYLICNIVKSYIDYSTKTRIKAEFPALLNFAKNLSDDEKAEIQDQLSDIKEEVTLSKGYRTTSFDEMKTPREWLELVNKANQDFRMPDGGENISTKEIFLSYYIARYGEYENNPDGIKCSIINLLINNKLRDLVILPELKEIISSRKKKMDDMPEGAEKRIYGDYISKISELSSPLLGEDGIPDDLFEVVGETTEPIEDDENSETPFLDRFGKNMLLDVYKYDEVIGRDTEIKKLIQGLCCRKKNSVVIVGPAGCGKTALVEELARRLSKDNVPKHLKGKTIYSLPLSSIEAGASIKGQLEDRVRSIIAELQSHRNIIVYIDEMHSMNYSEGIDISQILKPHIANGDITIIGGTTLDEYKKYIEKDKALVRRFIKIYVDEPAKEKALDIISKIAPAYENFHKVKYSKDVIKFIVESSIKYKHDGALPDKAIDIMNLAGSKCKIENTAIKGSDAKKVKKIQDEIDQAEKLKVEYTKSNEFDKALVEKNRLEKLKKDLKAAEAKAEADTKSWPKVSIMDVATVISENTNIPVSVIINPEIEKLRKLAPDLKKEVIGQDEAIDNVVKALCRSYLGFRNPDKPIASFLFVGPTGTGKTLICKKIAESVFGPEAFIRIDGGEFNQPHTDTKLLGAPPSYVGSDKPGDLDKVRERPFCVVLVDEVEKMHPDIVNKIFLNILDEGFVTMNNTSEKVYFRNAVIIFTSNLGTTKLEHGVFGYGTSDDRESTKDIIMSEVKRHLRPEVIGRISNIVVFNKLDREQLKTILDIELKKFLSRIDPDYVVNISDEAKEFILDKLDKKYGARNIEKVLNEQISDLICSVILESDVKTFNINFDSINKKLICI